VRGVAAGAVDGPLLLGHPPGRRRALGPGRLASGRGRLAAGGGSPAPGRGHLAVRPAGGQRVDHQEFDGDRDGRPHGEGHQEGELGQGVDGGQHDAEDPRPQAAGQDRGAGDHQDGAPPAEEQAPRPVLEEQQLTAAHGVETRSHQGDEPLDDVHRADDHHQRRGEELPAVG
jgi:hypothetical protein